MYALFLCLSAWSVQVLPASVNEQHSDSVTASPTNTCGSISEDDSTVRNLVQLGQKWPLGGSTISWLPDASRMESEIHMNEASEDQKNSTELSEVQKKEQKLDTEKQENDAGLHIIGAPITQLPKRNLTIVTIYDPQFETNLGTSYLWLNRVYLPHQWILFNNTANDPVSKLYAKAQDEATNELMVFVHPDVILPGAFYNDFMVALQKIESNTTNWGVLGTAGNAPGAWLAVISSVTDFDGSSPYFGGETGQKVQSVDESLIAVRRNGPRFDAEMPGFDLYGMDITLSARKAGQEVLYMKVPIKHKTKDVTGNTFLKEDFLKKVKSQEYVDRVNNTVQYMQKKWCNSSLLPIQAPAFFVDCDTWRMT